MTPAAASLCAAGGRIGCGRWRRPNPGIGTRVCDLAEEAGRRSLIDWAVAEYPELDVLVNNAGIQRRADLAAEQDAAGIRAEIAINLEAPIHLASLVIPHFRQRPNAAIVNVTSGLSFSPLARVAVYCATKAALHSFTLSLRKQLEGTGVEVIEIIPPAVDTDLGGPGLHKFGVSVDSLLDFVMPRLASGETEIAYGFAQQSSRHLAKSSTGSSSG